jgi:hypothetical protein
LIKESGNGAGKMPSAPSVGPCSPGEFDRLHTRIDQLNNEKRQLEFKAKALGSENEDLKELIGSTMLSAPGNSPAPDSTEVRKLKNEIADLKERITVLEVETPVAAMLRLRTIITTADWIDEIEPQSMDRCKALLDDLGNAVNGLIELTQKKQKAAADNGYRHGQGAGRRLGTQGSEGSNKCPLNSEKGKCDDET